jgi:hypothetical protein
MTRLRRDSHLARWRRCCRIGLSELFSAEDWNLPTVGLEVISDARVFAYREERV